MRISEMATAAYENARAKGFYDEPVSLGERIALIHSEASEALEVLRDGVDPHVVWYREDGKPEGLGPELADIVVRVGDMAAHLGIDLEERVREKMAFNATRPRKHGKRF